MSNANEASKPAAQQTLSDGAQFFACYLIDNCENEVVREESVQAWLGKMLASPRYHPAAPLVEQDERGAFLDWWCADVPENLREGWKERVDQCLRDGNATDRVQKAWEGFQFGVKLARGASTSANVQGGRRLFSSAEEFDKWAAASEERADQGERAAFVKLMGYDLPTVDGAAKDVWEGQRATWLEALEFAASTSANVAQDELQVRGRMRLKVEKLAGSLTKAEETKNDIIGDDGEQVTGVRIGWGAWALLRASIIDLIEYKCDSDSALAAAYSANVAQGAEAVTEDISLVRELQKALFYWMPRIAGEDSPAGHKAAEHAYLLIGLDDNSSECYGDQARSSLGIVNRELERIGIACSDAGCPDEMEVADFIADLYARAQAAATVASTDDARECLADVVSHYRALYAGLAFQLNEATVSENSDDMTYWKHEIKALERMYAQAERALAAAQSASGDTK